MTTELVMQLVRETVITALTVVGPIMLVGFVVGMTVSFVQAVMQIQEMTLAFVPKLFAIGCALILFGGWMLEKLSGYTVGVLGGFFKIVKQ